MARTATCRQCQKPNLVWRDTGKGWRLAEGIGGEIHSCCTFENNAEKPTMGQSKPKPFGVDETLYNEHLSRMEQDNTERLTTMVLGL